MFLFGCFVGMLNRVPVGEGWLFNILCIIYVVFLIGFLVASSICAAVAVLPDIPKEDDSIPEEVKKP